MVSIERLTTKILGALPGEKYLSIKLEAVGDPDLSFAEQIQRLTKTIFINHSEKLAVTKNNQESNRRAQENGRESVMSTTVITCHYCKNQAQSKRLQKKMESEIKIEKSRKSNNERKKQWCSYHNSSGHSNDDCIQQMKRQEHSRTEDRKKCVVFTIITGSHSNEECYQQKRGSPCKDSSPTVHSKNSGKPEIYVVDSTTVDCKPF